MEYLFLINKFGNFTNLWIFVSSRMNFQQVPTPALLICIINVIDRDFSYYCYLYQIKTKMKKKPWDLNVSTDYVKYEKTLLHVL